MTETDHKDLIAKVEQDREKLIQQIADAQKTIERSRELLTRIDNTLSQLRKP